MKKFKKGIVKKGDTWRFSGFILPLEAFAFECIPNLGRTFRVTVDADNECPRLCKHMFKDIHMRGYKLKDINHAIGLDKDIISILEPTTDEESLMELIIDPGCDDGIGYVDPIVDGWRNHLIVQKKKLWWESLYKEELAGRDITENVEEEEEETQKSATIVELNEVIKAFANRMDRMEVVTREIQDKFGDWNERLVDVERSVKDLRDKAVESAPCSFALRLK
ncbi:unnamed protein product [Microthlaspi erraticum]|uniref:DUF287 domain-containing protein n=1 Tax=Microthlaspi erraticum TaxID=1685480 RepID=A0A6D2IVT8_9BRAS|nr:unnamed protein product [Microthlaspi erraticum]